MRWREYINDLYSTRNQPATFDSKAEFKPPVSAKQLEQAEAQLGIRLPDELRSLLLDSDGVMEMMSVGGDHWFENNALVWPLRELVEQNGRLAVGDCSRGSRSNSRHRVCLFGWAGCDGIAFGFPLAADGRCSPEVAAWYPVGDRLIRVAPRLEEFIAGWIQCRISV